MSEKHSPTSRRQFQPVALEKPGKALFRPHQQGHAGLGQTRPTPRSLSTASNRAPIIAATIRRRPSRPQS
ncbi:hypothetical protein HLB25_02940 [Dickeya dadantii]|uniref:hypothetical protein n=1 Tax=Dickeya dadantii TaxID=204038 RepID=UPI001495A927|nr:hypothetical protein [Dickeya dadantii]NPE55574.1 hypothetical protein [Dickeya dadantii]NPE65818.1 hypothetical protein [Dickeya dadantii]